MKDGIKLPDIFLERMKDILGDEFESFLTSFEDERVYGLRVNRQKLSCEEFEALVPFPVRPIPWIEGGYFYDSAHRPARCPLYQAGLYYLQDPSAMTPASLLPVSPGDRVLDLCAAPGGKATALADKLRGEGLLLANDVSLPRARALLRNLELFGVPNLLVTAEEPEKLCASFPEFFDKVMLDAPCSGEGMFRKDDSLIADWSPEKVSSLIPVQKKLALLAADMLRPGGIMCYSTCSYEEDENEGVVSYLLRERPSLSLIELPERYGGFRPGIAPFSSCIRMYPHGVEGEGQFVALLRKAPVQTDIENIDRKNMPTPGRVPEKDFSERDFSERKKARKKPGRGGQEKAGAASRAASEKVQTEAISLLSNFMDSIGLVSFQGKPFCFEDVILQGERLYLCSHEARDIRGLNFLRNGLYLGDIKKNRFEPSAPLALALRKSDVRRVISLPSGDERLASCLRGESFPVEAGEAVFSDGWCLMAADGYPLSFGKLVNGMFKNKYPAGWRQQA